MPAAAAEAAGWTIVGRRGKRRGRRSGSGSGGGGCSIPSNPREEEKEGKDDSPPSQEQVEGLVEELQALSAKLRGTPWCRSLLEGLAAARGRMGEALSSPSSSSRSFSAPIESITCYGVGNFGSKYNHAPRYQLAAALILRDQLGAPLSFFEPRITLLEAAALHRLGIEQLEENDMGKRRVGVTGTAIFFMPHCPMTLYSNLLWAHWGPELGRLLVLGNSWEGYDLSCVGQERHSDPTNCIMKALKMSAELSVEPQPVKGSENQLPHLFPAFNDLCWCFFPRESLLTDSGKAFLSERPQEFYPSNTTNNDLL
jgi:hypothetical protein